MEDALGIYLSVTVDGGDCYAINQSCEGAIEVAYRDWRLSQRDTILTLELLAGDEFTLAASIVHGYALSTPAGRARNRAIRRESDRVDREERQADGWTPGGDP